MRYELWVIPGGNAVDDFATLDEALEVVRQMLDGVPWEAADDLMLNTAYRDGSGEPVATGIALAKLAFDRVATPS